MFLCLAVLLPVNAVAFKTVTIKAVTDTGAEVPIITLTKQDVDALKYFKNGDTNKVVAEIKGQIAAMVKVAREHFIAIWLQRIKSDPNMVTMPIQDDAFIDDVTRRSDYSSASTIP